MPPPADLLDRFQQWLDAKPARTVHTWLEPSGAEGDAYSFAELWRRAGDLASRLRARLPPGARVALCFPPGLEFLVAFHGCLRAGVYAVPADPPDPRREDATRLAAIVASSGAKLALSEAAYLAARRIARCADVGVPWLATDAADIQGGRPPSLPPTTGVAFLQYTSGSTAAPKGVVVTRRNLAHNLTLITDALGSDESTVCVSWLPHYHDMGLVGSLLGTLYCGGAGFHSSPLAFVGDPTRWVRDMTRRKATHIQAPSFAYGLAARKFLEMAPSKRPAVDLSSLVHAINAAEPIRAADVDAFYAAFGDAGLGRGVIRPTYGLAEHTVFVSSNGRLRETFDADALEAGTAASAAPGARGVTLFGCGAVAQSAQKNSNAGRGRATVASDGPLRAAFPVGTRRYRARSSVAS